MHAAHPDYHCCAALFKYFKSKAVEEKDHVMAFCSDDKSKIHVREPNAPVLKGVRGRRSITPKLVTLEGLDHDMHKSYLTPNVALRCDVPASSDKYFVRGNVYYTVSDSVFQSSTPFCHGLMIFKIIKELKHVPRVLMKYTDDGTNQSNALESVKVGLICLFKGLNLDFMISARCAPEYSYMNPAERIISMLYLGLQNVETERAPCDDKSIEKKIKKMQQHG